MLLDNKNHGKVIAALRSVIKTDSSLSIHSKDFSVYGFASLQKELIAGKSTKLLLSSWEKITPTTISGSQTDWRLKNKLDQAVVSSECLLWAQKGLEVRALTSIAAQQNLFHVKNTDGEEFSIQGSSTFTASGLGETKSDVLDMNIGIQEQESIRQLAQWFDVLWNDKTAAKDIKAEFLSFLEYLSSEKTPATIYYITLFNIFNDILEEIDEDIKERNVFGS